MENQENGLRIKLIHTVFESFVPDLNLSVKPLTEISELIYFIETLREYIEGVLSECPPSDVYEGFDFDRSEFVRNKLLKKLRDKTKGLLDTNFLDYLDPEVKVKTRLFEKLKITEPILTEYEFDRYINIIDKYFIQWLGRALLLPENTKIGDNIKPQEIQQANEEPEGKIKNPEFTRKRQALLFYFLLKLIGIDARQGGSMAAVTRFGHVLFNWPYTNISNAGLYDIVKDLPYVKADKLLLIDLEFVKRQFIDIKHADGINLVQKEIDSINKTLK